MVVPRFTRTEQRNATLDECDVCAIVYGYHERGRNLPSRAVALEVFNRWFSTHDQKPYGTTRRIWSRTVTLNNIVNRIREYARDEETRFIFRIQRGYLLYRPCPEQEERRQNGETTVCNRYEYRIHYAEKNSNWHLPDMNAGQWGFVNNTTGLNRWSTSILGADLYSGLTVPDTSRNVRQLLEYRLDIRPLLGDRMGSDL